MKKMGDGKKKPVPKGRKSFMGSRSTDSSFFSQMEELLKGTDLGTNTSQLGGESDDVEEVEIDKIQGIQGLRALRVSYLKEF